MKKAAVVALLLVGATILGATALREPIASAAQSISANITGPLDANGNVKVHEQGTALVGITGVPDVKLDATANSVKLDPAANGVRITNADDAPVPTRDTENPARQQFNDMVHIEIPSGSASGSGQFQLPQGKYLVITHVSGQAELDPGQHPLLQLQFATFKHFLPFTLVVSPGAPYRDLWQLSEALDVIYGPASHVTAYLSRIDTAGAADADVTLSGYLVDASP
jgi:hypothetical protein